MTSISQRRAIFFIMVVAALASSALLGVSVSAQESGITYPVAELGGCTDKKACRAYCDDLSHVTECVAFAEAHGLIGADEAREAREFSRLGGKGPGGCTSREKCEAYCEDPSHMRQCIAFAKSAGMMEEHELKEAEKVIEHMESGGKMPGNCRGEKQCRAYCEVEEHVSECADFAIKMGFMSEKEAEMFRKTGGKGPGGCTGRQCQAYCEDETHREECIAFATEHDLMSEEDKARMREGMQQAQSALEKAPPAVLSCIEAVIGAAKLDEVKRGVGIVSPRLGQILPQCFREVMGKEERRGAYGRGIPAEARDCMREVFGDDFEERMKSGDVDPGARDNEIRECMQKSLGEGYLSDDGRWERPERGTPPEGRDDQTTTGEERMMQEEYHREFEGQYDDRRAEMEQHMREEMQRQMESGEFDRSRLPPDYRPEGMFPPPESFHRPPEGSSMPPGGMPMPPEGYSMPPDGMSMPPEGYMPPPPPSDIDTRPTTARAQFMANVLGIFQSLFGIR